MKLAYYTDQVYLHGGIEKVLSQKLNYFANCTEVAEIHLITTEQKDNSFCYPIDQKVIQHDLAINYDRVRSYFHPINFLKVPKHIHKLKGILKSIQPDVLIVCNYAFDFYFIPFISKGIKTIKEYHSSRYYYMRDFPKASKFQKWMYKLNSYIEKKYSHIVTLNEDELNYYQSVNVVVIPNSIQLKSIETSNKRKQIILAAGRISQVKQFDHLILAWSFIAKKFPDWEVHIYGEGDEVLKNNLNLMILAQNVKNIYLKGATSGLESKMNEATIFAMTSQTECFPMVLLEALAYELPVISYDCPHGPKNILKNGEVGILVNPTNPEAFATRLEHFITDKEHRNDLASAGLIHVRQFSEAVIMQKWLLLFYSK